MDASPARRELPSAPAGTPDLIDPRRADPARRYDYWLGGKTNFAADRASGDAIAERFPTVRLAALENRRFLQRAVTVLARDMGVRQFLDIDTGIPASPNVHETAQLIAPDARVVYVDSSPIVVTHARALMTSTPRGATAYLQADLRDPEAILSDQVLRETLDPERPVALLLVAVLHFLDDTDDPYALVARLLKALPAGSYLVLTHATLDPLPDQVAEQLRALSGQNPEHGTFRPRSRDEVARFFDGLTIAEPGLCSIVRWRPDERPRPTATEAETAVYGAVARLH